jgi:hypothetical protein
MAGEVHKVAIDVIDRSIPIGNNRNIAVINKPNPVYGYEATAKEVAHLIQIPMYYIYEAGTPNIIDGTNYYDYFPEEGGGGGGGGDGDISRYTIRKFTDGSTGEVTYKLMQSLNKGSYVSVGEVVGMRGNQLLVTYGGQLSILDTVLSGIKEKIDATYNFTTFNELNITTSGKTLKQITDELYAKNLPTNTIVTGELYTEALPFSGNGEAEVMINGSAFWWKCSSLDVAPYSWNAICGGGSYSGVIMDWTPTYVTEQPMVFKGSATLTADSTDTTKCSITVSTPSTASRIKRGYMYKVTSITASPAYTGTIKVGDTLIADKDGPVIGATWTVDTDWTVVPSGDEEGKIYYAAAGGGLQLSGADNNEFGHSNAAITPQTELGVYKVKHDALGHIIESEATSTVSAVTGLVTAAPTETAPPNAITYTSYANERLTFHKIGFTTDNSFVSTKEPVIVLSRYVDFTANETTRTGNPDTHPVYMGINRCNVADDGTINAYYGDAGYTEDGSNGQVMVKIPKFYYKVTPDSDGGLDGVHIRKCTWEISDTADEGFTLYPAFYDANGNEIDYFLYGAFDGVGQRDSAYGTSYNTASDKLSSVAGSSMLPVKNLTRARARIMATNRGTGWYSAGVKQTMAVQMLMAVEYGFNSQVGIGQGVVSTSAATYAGQTTGNVTSGTQDNKTTPVNWRGIENFWGNIYDWIDGLNTSDKVPYFCNSYTFVDDTSSGYTQISFSLPSSNYITALGYDSNNPWVLLPSESSGSSNPTGPISDYVLSYSGWCVARLGGYWNDDSSAGAFCWACNNDSSNTNSNIGARLMYIPSAV